MIGNNEMDVDPPFPTIIEAADTSVVILDSPTPVRVTKKRKISISGVDQNKTDDDSCGMAANILDNLYLIYGLDVKNTPAASNYPVIAVGATIKSDMKRLIKSQESEIVSGLCISHLLIDFIVQVLSD